MNICFSFVKAKNQWNGSVIKNSNNWITPNFQMARLGKNGLNKNLGLLFLHWGFSEQRRFYLGFVSHRWKGDYFFSFGHCCSSQCNWQKSHFACTLLCKQSWCSWYTVLTLEGLATHTHSTGELKDEDHSPDKRRALSPKRFAVLNGDREWGREKEEAPGRRPHLCLAADSGQGHKLCGQRKESCGSFSSCSLGSLPRPGLWVETGIGFFAP